jgi:hypothetical protein
VVGVGTEGCRRGGSTARGKRRGGHSLGQHVTRGGKLGSTEASGVVGRW